MANLDKIAKKAVHDPVGAATDLIGSALGIGQGASKLTYKRRQDAQIRNVKLAQAGDGIALAMLGAIGGVKPLPGQVSGSPYTWRGATFPLGWSSRTAAWGKAYKNIIDRAASWYASIKAGGVKPWDGSSTTAPTVDSSSQPEDSPTESPTPISDVPPVAKPPKPCKYGLRVPDGMGGSRCPKKSEMTSSPGGSTGAPLSGGSKRPCKYGQRGADGYCPKKPATTFTKKQNRDLNALSRKASSLAEKVVVGGLTGAGKALKLALPAGIASFEGLAAAAGVSVGTAVALVGAAALAGWMIGRQISKELSGEAQEQRLADAAVDANHARAALAKALGKDVSQLTKQEQQAIRDAYNLTVDRIKNPGKYLGR